MRGILLCFSALFFNYHNAETENEEIENINQTIETEDDLLDNKTQTGNAFVKFFKYGQHSLLWRGINGGTAGFLKLFLQKSKNHSDLEFRINTKADIILNLFSFCYDCKYIIKDRLGLFLNCSCFGGLLNFSLLNDDELVHFLNINFGVSYVLLRKKNFLWNIYAGIGVTWGFSPFSWKSSYNVNDLEDDDLKTKFKKDIEDKGGLFKSGEWKKYFNCKQFKKNIKHFDVIFDCSVFDFTIKDHFRVTLEWKGGIGDIYKMMLYRKELTTFEKFADICLANLSLNIGYVF